MSGVLFSHKGIRERRFCIIVLNFNLMCRQVGHFTGSNKRVETHSKSGNLAVNSLSLSRDLPVFTAF